MPRQNNQYRFLPDEPLRGIAAYLRLNQIASPVVPVGADFVESVRSMGILQPIVVVKSAQDTYTVVAGRRRVSALREIVVNDGGSFSDGLVPATVFPANTSPSVLAAVGLTENTQRAPNPLADLENIESLLRRGADREGIARELHISPRTVQSRLALVALIPDLRAGLRSGSLSPALAARVARLPLTRQRELAARGGPIRASDLQPEGVEQPSFFPSTTARIGGRTGRYRIDPAASAETERLAAYAGNAPREVPVHFVPLPPLDESGLATEHSWNGVLRCLERAIELQPTSAGAEDDQIAEWLEDLAALAERRLAAVA